MKKILKSRIFIFITTAILFAGIGVYGATTYKYRAEEISYNPSNGEPTNVNDVLNELYNIKSLGDATEEDIVEGKTAVVQGKLISGTNDGMNMSEVEIIASGTTWKGTYTFNFTTLKTYKVALVFASGKNGYIEETNSWKVLKNSAYNSGDDYGMFKYGIGYCLNLLVGDNSVTFTSGGNAPYFYYIIGIN